MNIITRNKLKEALKGKGPCKGITSVKDRMQYLWKNSAYKGADPLDETLILMEHSGNNIILDFICSENDGVFLKNIEASDSTKNLFQDQSAILCEMSDFIKVLTDSCADEDIDPGEIDRMTKEFDDLAKVFYGFIQAAEKGKR